MLPTLKVIFATMIAACAAVLTISAGVIATRDPGEPLAGVPSISRPLVRQAIVEDSDWQHVQLLAYTRRADELQRLRDLPTAPARAVVEYAERAQKAAEAEGAPAASPALAPAPAVDTAAPALPPPPGETTADTAPSSPPAAQPAPTVVASAPAAAPLPPPDEPPAVASAPAAIPAEAPAAPPVAAITEPASAPSPQVAPAQIPEAPAATAEPAPTPAAASGATQVANVQSGSGETAAIKATETRTEAKPHHRAKSHARKEPHKKEKSARIARTRLAPAAQTGFPVDLPKTTQGAGTNPAQQDWR